MEPNYSTQQLDILMDAMRKQKERFDKAASSGTTSEINFYSGKICETSKAITEAVSAMHAGILEKIMQ